MIGCKPNSTDACKHELLVQERCNSIANALELHLSCTKPLKYKQTNDYTLSSFVVISWILLLYIDGLVQERRNSSVLAMELRLSCTNPSTEYNPERWNKYIVLSHSGCANKCLSWVAISENNSENARISVIFMVYTSSYWLSKTRCTSDWLTLCC